MKHSLHKQFWAYLADILVFLAHNCLALAQDVEDGASGLVSLNEYDTKTQRTTRINCAHAIAMENYLQKMNVTTDQVRQKYGTELWLWYGHIY